MFYKHSRSLLEVRTNCYSALLETWLLLVNYIAFICVSLNTLLHWFPCFHPCLRNDNNCEEDAGEADTGNANEDGGEPELGLEQQEQLGDGEAKKPKRAVVQASYRLLGKKAGKKEGVKVLTCSLGSKSSPRRV